MTSAAVYHVKVKQHSIYYTTLTLTSLCIQLISSFMHGTRLLTTSSAQARHLDLLNNTYCAVLHSELQPQTNSLWIEPKLLYASCAWSGFVSHTDRKRVDAFLQRSKRCGFCPPDLSRFDELLKDADSTLFHKVATDSHHVLHQLLPPFSSASQNYSLRHRTHQFSLPDHTGRLMDCNSLIRSLFKDVY